MKTDMLDIYSDYLIAQSHQAIAIGLSSLFEGSLPRPNHQISQSKRIRL